jgi:cytochrome c-type biogenesis protein CcmE
LLLADAIARSAAYDLLDCFDPCLCSPAGDSRAIAVDRASRGPGAAKRAWLHEPKDGQAARGPGAARLRGALRYFAAMHRSRRGTARLVVSLAAAVVLACALMYTSFSAADPTVTPSALLRDSQPGRAYQLTGVVVAHSVHRQGEVLDFSVADRQGSTAVPVAYTGEVSDSFKEGREVIVTVRRAPGGDSFVGERNSLITKCPSKYKAAPPHSSGS